MRPRFGAGVGTGTFDATLPPALAASRIVSHFYRQLAFDGTRATATGIADAIRSNGIDINGLIPQAQLTTHTTFHYLSSTHCFHWLPIA